MQRCFFIFYHLLSIPIAFETIPRKCLTFKWHINHQIARKKLITENSNKKADVIGIKINPKITRNIIAI